MASKILAATPHAAFGELIRQSLEEVGRYQVDVATSRADAVARCQKGTYDLAILDSDLDGAPFADLVRAIADLMPGLRLVVIPPDNDARRAGFTGLPIQAFLNKPFYLPDLIETIEKLLPLAPIPATREGQDKPAGANTAPLSPGGDGPAPALASSSPKTTPAWLLDPAQAEAYLAQLSRETSALAALLTRSGHLWAFAGSLPKTGAPELMDNLSRGWDPHSGTDLARYIRMASTGRQYMLFASCLASDLVIALVYETMTPFSKIRSQASKLSRDLIHRPPPQPASPEAVPAQEEPIAQESVDVPEATPVFDLDFGWEEGVEPLPLNLPPLLDEVPPPDPQPRRSSVPEPGPAEAWINELGGQPAELQAREDLLDAIEAQARDEEVGEPVKEPLAAAVKPGEWVAEAPDQEPQIYTFILVPRSPSHYLTGEVARQLSEWMPRICQDFGWKIEALSIRPNFLQWSIQVPRTGSSPDGAAKIVRLQTSRRLFEAFPPLQAESGSSTQFWAPGYLILSGLQTASTQLVREFITQSRQKLDKVDGRL